MVGKIETTGDPHLQDNPVVLSCLYKLPVGLYGMTSVTLKVIPYLCFLFCADIVVHSG